MYEDFLEKYCEKHGISEEEALKHAVVKGFLEEKEGIDRELSDMQQKDEHNRR